MVFRDKSPRQFLANVCLPRTLALGLGLLQGCCVFWRSVGGSGTFSALIIRMLGVLAEGAGPFAMADKSRRFGRDLLDAPQDASDLLAALACGDTSGPEEESLSRLLGAALDEARMARENGQQKGAVFIERLEAQLGALVGHGLTVAGRLLVARTWVRVGLAAPDCLALPPDEDAVAGDPAETEAMLNDLLRSMTDKTGTSVSALHALFAELLPTVPPEARQVLVRITVARPSEVYADLGCAWLLEGNAGADRSPGSGTAFRAGGSTADHSAQLAGR